MDERHVQQAPTTRRTFGDIRIVAQEHEQPILFGAPIVSTYYTLVDWDTDQRINDETFDTLPQAEKRAYELALPRLMQMAKEAAS